MTFLKKRSAASRLRLAALTWIAFVLQTACATSTAQRSVSSIPATTLFALINQHRESHGLSTLTQDPVLTQVASQHAQYLCHERKLTHEGTSSVKSPMQRVLSAGGDFDLVAEVVGCASANPKDILESWIQSHGHRSKLTHPGISKMGIGETAVEPPQGCDHIWVVVLGG
jgi:uncharacterized protein YkwD